MKISFYPGAEAFRWHNAFLDGRMTGQPVTLRTEENAQNLADLTDILCWFGLVWFGFMVYQQLSVI